MLNVHKNITSLSLPDKSGWIDKIFKFKLGNLDV